ncbi:MAG: UDP-N-acetylmuramate dehydrogenase [Planctomycetaceae bacterium]
MLPVEWRRRFSGRYAAGEALGPRTSWRIGGPAELYLEPADAEELTLTLASLQRVGMPFRILGGGSNLLVADRGVAGAVLSLDRMGRIERQGDRLRVEAGARLSSVVRRAVEEGLTGAERLAGIPGRVGGAIFGNSGGRYGSIESLVEEIELLRGDGVLERIRPPADFFHYRRSGVGERVVLRVLLRLEPAVREAVRATTRRIVEERRSTQPGWVGNAGCVFKNPPGQSAGRLIDLAGLKGSACGPLHVSPLHANFFENAGGATEEDVVRLVERVQETVRRVHGVELELEVRRWP